MVNREEKPEKDKEERKEAEEKRRESERQRTRQKKKPRYNSSACRLRPKEVSEQLCRVSRYEEASGGQRFHWDDREN
ncbi:uncharacterized [Tachysurus ichikawai]